ncbi:hypothetical protein CJ030_MR4G026705 [Morella rubra]|uniref:PB1-like domain-containing protein n=1 Tax=Morella rubra TaxID=262757 RepID=A0A6A1VWN8_9ROSI|nr:hypothetical protein CJ030_MR4G026705 [Morella rubra]
MVKVFLHHGGVLNFVRSVYEGGNVSFQSDVDLDYFSVTHMMKTFTKELKYNDICELWCTIGEEGLETGLCRLHSNEDVLQIIKRLERTPSDDLHVYTVHSKDGSNYFNTVQSSSKGAGEGSSKGATIEAVELDDESIEDLEIDEVCLGGMGEGGEEDDNTSKKSFESEEDSLMFSDWDDTDEDEIEIFPVPHGVNRVAGQHEAVGLEGQDGQGEVDDRVNGQRVIMLGREIGGML